MATPYNPDSYHPKFRQIIELIASNADEEIIIQYKDSKKMQHERAYFYGYRRAVQKRYDYLNRTAATIKGQASVFVQEEILDLKSMMEKIPNVRLTMSKDALTLTFNNAYRVDEEDPMLAALARKLPKVIPKEDWVTPDGDTFEDQQEFAIEQTVGEGRQNYIPPSEMVGELPSTAALLGIESTEILEGNSDIEETAASTEVDSPAAVVSAADSEMKKTIESLRVAFTTLSAKETLNAAQENTLAKITDQLMDLDPSFVDPDVVEDLAAIEKTVNDIKLI